MRRSVLLVLILVMFLLLLSPCGVARQNAKEPRKPAGVSGTYKLVLNTLEVLELPDHKVRIRFSGFWPNDKKRAESRNSGVFDETVGFEGRTATVKIQFGDDPCTVKLDFRPGKVMVEQSGSLMGCGFGFNVEPDGTYVKVSSKPPKLPAVQ